MARALTTLLTLALAALALPACELSMLGKNRCLTNADCLDSFECRAGICADRDSCARPCGSQCCGNGQTCDGEKGVCLGTCKPSCTGRQCGYSGCPGETCGECGLGFRCSDGTCELCVVPDCAGKECGPDGCGRQCGTCSPGYFCNWESQCERGGMSDAGTVWHPDAGVAPPDSGVVSTPDSGPGETDSGSPLLDGGGDAGLSPSDAGADTGAPAVDAGPTLDAQVGRDAT